MPRFTFPMVFVLVLLIFSFIAFLPPVWGDAFVVDPIVEKARPGETIDIGSVTPGDSLELIISSDSGYGENTPWTFAQLENTTHNTIQTTNAIPNEKSLITHIHTSPSTPTGNHSVMLNLRGNPEDLRDETYTILFRVENKLVKTSLAVREVSGKVHYPTTFSILLVNDSSTPIPLNVQPVLPLTWAQPQEITLKPHSFATLPLEITPRFGGPKSFDILISRQDTGMTVDHLEGTIVAYPSIKDRYIAGFYGFPFFTISLVANTLTNAFFGLLL